MKKAKKVVRFISVFIGLLTVTLMIYGLMNAGMLNEKVSSGISDYGISALFIISLLLDLIPQMISPVLAMGAGILIGMNVYAVIITTILGSTVGSIIGFILGKKYLFDAVDTMSSKKAVKRMTHLTNKYGKIIVPLAAISPLPYLPVVLGAINFSKRNFLIYGLIPRAISIIVFGYLICLI
jgi:membrane protein YqaA with SNARE-associated domain